MHRLGSRTEKLREKGAGQTFAVESALLGRTLPFVEVLIAHFRCHRDAFSGRLGDVLGHSKATRDNVVEERHLDFYSGAQ